MESNAKKAMLPMGMENFEDIRKEGFYYIDKTGMIKELLQSRSYVNLFTRPRRFGKTLNMSMLKYFFNIGTDSTLFDGLEISKENKLCDRYMGKFPVISISLKGVSGRSFDEARRMLRWIIINEAMRFQFLMQSDRLTEAEKGQYNVLIDKDNELVFKIERTDEALKNSLLNLSQLLQKHYGQKTIILIDEYDVPLDRAYQNGYYDEMVELIRGLFGQAFKTNDSLYMAVLTGCLRVSKESIFTGLNNFKVYTVKDLQYNECFGFTDAEVRKMLEYYGFMEQYDAIKKWYDGYRFGNLGIYCPWDVINYCMDFLTGNAIRPQNYWVNTSSNSIIKKFVEMAKQSTRDEIELLINGGSIKKQLRQELTYRDFDSKPDNFWSLLFTTGYLTQCGEEYDELTDTVTTGLVIPNREIRWVYMQQIRDWFDEETVANTQKLEEFCRAFEGNDASAIEEVFNSYLKKTISIRDTSVRKEMKENFYHGILLGILSNIDGWDVSSNAESGEGYSDISVEVADKKIGIVIELKYAENALFDDGCRAALRQIENKNYAETLLDNGMKTVYKYGIACYKKRCRVMAG